MVSNFFYDMLETAIINSFVLMKECMAVQPGVINRRRHFNQQEIRKNLVQRLAQIEDGEEHLLATSGRKQRTSLLEPAGRICEHCPLLFANRRNCASCWSANGKEVTSRYFCSKCMKANNNPVQLCIQTDSACFAEYHSANYNCWLLIPPVVSIRVIVMRLNGTTVELLTKFWSTFLWNL